jgi:cobalt-zinc-cadmium efflux system outer membrane protein
MSRCWLLITFGFLFVSGCLYHTREHIDEVVCNLADHPYDPGPILPPESKPKTPDSKQKPDKEDKTKPSGQATDVQTTAWMEAAADKEQKKKPAFEVPKVPGEIPGSEAQDTIPKQLPRDPEERKKLIQRLYPKLPPLPTDPQPVPGPGGVPYTLASLQQIAAENSPTLRQAASDVEAARGALIQARAYPNPTLIYQAQPSNDGETAGVQGFAIDQVIKFFGKLKLAAAAAEMDLDNAQLALRRARSDLSTAVRSAYFAVLVAKETVRVNKALAEYTDKVYVLSGEGLLKAAGFAAPYEPAALRELAYSARLAYKQAISTYIYSWKQLVAAIGLPQLPLSEVAGRIDAAIPYFDYDTVRAYVLNNHTDVLTSRNGIDKARYLLKSAQIAPYPDFDVNVGFLQEFVLLPKQFTHTVSIGVPLPIWDQNKGNIKSAEAALVRATEEPHRVAESLTNTLAIAYTGYKNNLDALEYYRRFILPDSVRYYQGVFRRRNIDLTGVAFADLVTSQQTLASNVTTYLGLLNSMWSSGVSVADVLQIDDLFQMGKPHPIPPLPDLNHLPLWPCCHGCPGPHGATPGCAGGLCPQGPAGPPVMPVQESQRMVLPPPTPANSLETPLPSEPTQPVQVLPVPQETSSGEVQDAPCRPAAGVWQQDVPALPTTGKQILAETPAPSAPEETTNEVPLLPASEQPADASASSSSASKRLPSEAGMQAPGKTVP